MGLLDMMGSSWDDPKTAATLNLAAGLLSTRGIGGLVNGMQGYAGTLAQAKRAAQEEAERKQIAEMRAMQLQQMQQAMADEQERRAALGRMAGMIAPPTGGMVPGAAPTTPAQIEAAAGTPGYGEGSSSPKMAPADPQSQFMYEAMKSRLISPMDYLNATRKDTAPVKLGAGETMVAPDGKGGFRVVFQNDKAPAQTDLAKLIAEMQALPPGHPMRAVYQSAIAKATTHQPPVNVTYGAPVAGVDKDGKPVFFQPDRAGGPPSIIPGVAPPPKETPAALREKLAQNSVTLNKIEKAIDLVDKKPGSLGALNYLGDTIMQRLDPGGTDVRAMIADIAGQKIHDRSGAAVTVGEAARLKPYIPNTTDTPETAKKKLELFRAEYAAMQQAINSGASVSDASAPQSSGGGQVRRYNPLTGRIE